MRPSTSEYRPNPESTIPARFREHLFREIAPALGAALRAFPSVTEVLTTLTNETFRRRFTEAIEAKRRYGWKHSDVSESLFASTAAKLRTAIIGDQLYIGSLESLKLVRNKNAEPLGSAVEPKPESASIPTEVKLGYLNDFARVLPHFVPRPTNFFVRNLNPDQQSYYESKHDIGFAQDEVDKTIFHIL